MYGSPEEYSGAYRTRPACINIVIAWLGDLLVTVETKAGRPVKDTHLQIRHHAPTDSLQLSFRAASPPSALAAAAARSRGILLLLLLLLLLLSHRSTSRRRNSCQQPRATPSPSCALNVCVCVCVCVCQLKL